MSGSTDRDRLLQEHLDGGIEEEELCRRLPEGLDPREVEGELAAYRAVWSFLGEPPSWRLPDGFARRTARRAVGARESRAADWILGILVGGGATGATVAAAIALAHGLAAAGLDPAALLWEAAGLLGHVPSALPGAAASGATLYLADRLWRPGGRSAATGG